MTDEPDVDILREAWILGYATCHAHWHLSNYEQPLPDEWAAGIRQATKAYDRFKDARPPKTKTRP